MQLLPSDDIIIIPMPPPPCLPSGLLPVQAWNLTLDGCLCIVLMPDYTLTPELWADETNKQVNRGWGWGWGG